MIPTVICQAFSPEDQLYAFAIGTTALLIGWVMGRLRGTFWAWTILFLPVFMPIAYSQGFWPFDTRWKNELDCGGTPDPSVLAIGATMLFPLLSVGAYLASKWFRRAPPGRKPDLSEARSGKPPAMYS